jgi:hypothetical protein
MPEPFDNMAQTPRRKKVLRALNFNKAELSSDIEQCRSLQHTLKHGTLEEASAIIRSEELEQWLLSPTRSSDLLINGNRPDAGADPMSPLSLVIAELATICSLSKNAVVTSYFCGLHADFGQSATAGPAAMLRSFIGQIVKQSSAKKFGYDLSSIDEHDWESAADLDLEVIGNILHDLVFQLPKDKILFFLVDGISAYEAWNDAEHDLQAALKVLAELVRKKTDVVVKVLLTCPGTSMHVGDDGGEKEIGVDDVLTLSENVDTGMRGIWDMEDMEESFSSALDPIAANKD